MQNDFNFLILHNYSVATERNAIAGIVTTYFAKNYISFNAKVTHRKNNGNKNCKQIKAERYCLVCKLGFSRSAKWTLEYACKQRVSASFYSEAKLTHEKSNSK